MKTNKRSAPRFFRSRSRTMEEETHEGWIPALASRPVDMKVILAPLRIRNRTKRRGGQLAREKSGNARDPLSHPFCSIGRRTHQQNPIAATFSKPEDLAKAMIFWKTTRLREGEATPEKSFWMVSPLREVDRKNASASEKETGQIRLTSQRSWEAGRASARPWFRGRSLRERNRSGGEEGVEMMSSCER